MSGQDLEHFPLNSQTGGGFTLSLGSVTKDEPENEIADGQHEQNMDPHSVFYCFWLDTRFTQVSSVVYSECHRLVVIP